MTDNQNSAPHMLARLAGLLYLIVVVTGVFSLAYAPSRIFASAEAQTVLSDVARNEQLFRFAIFAEAICYTAFLLLPLALYRLLAAAGPALAATMAALAMASVPIGFTNVLHYLRILSLAGQPETASLGAQAMLALDAYGDGLLLLQVFWGLWLIPLGFLIARGRPLPGIIGVCLMLAGAGYFIDFSGRLLWEDYGASGIGAYLRPLRMSEMAICAWLLLFGARGLPLAARTGRTG
ncbi:MAG TPA: DUF4386 domain-containing protein [Parvularculaceae bacterium]|nr:DUF4386 domain-containing protein [Amphiplicatus sp.]HOP18942.1 DUF4386 domain-containing protein [Amphiplicatus sp.]HPE31561.1 DUF4386 domain-containing protein [Parvularculaceae bacterium]HRX38607.1 DUF4386 domain-containing protein [Parvularculaceae bacterium]